MSKLSTQDLERSIKEMKNPLINKNIIPDRIYTVVTNHPNKGDQYSCTGAQLLETRDAYLSLFEAEKSGDKQRIIEAITRITNLK